MQDIEWLITKSIRESRFEVELVKPTDEPVAIIDVPFGVSLRKGTIIHLVDGRYVKLVSSMLMDYFSYGSTYPAMKIVVEEVKDLREDKKWRGTM